MEMVHFFGLKGCNSLSMGGLLLLDYSLFQFCFSIEHIVLKKRVQWIVKRNRGNTMLLVQEAKPIKRNLQRIRNWVLLLNQRVLIQELFFVFLPYNQAFSVNSAISAKRTIQRNLDRGYKKVHAPMPDRSAGTNPPMVIVVMGPPKVGKTTLIKVDVFDFFMILVSDQEVYKAIINRCGRSYYSCQWKEETSYLHRVSKRHFLYD